MDVKCLLCNAHKERRLGIREQGPDKAKNPKPMTLYTPWSPGQPYFRTTLLQAGLVLPRDQSQLFVQDGLSMYLWRQIYTAVGKGRNGWRTRRYGVVLLTIVLDGSEWWVLSAASSIHMLPLATSSSQGTNEWINDRRTAEGNNVRSPLRFRDSDIPWSLGTVAIATLYSSLSPGCQVGVFSVRTHSYILFVLCCPFPGLSCFFFFLYLYDCLRSQSITYVRLFTHNLFI